MRSLGNKYLLIHMAKNILRKQFGNMYGKEKPYQYFESKPIPPIEPPLFSLTSAIFFILAILGVAILYLNRERAYSIATYTWSQFKPTEQIDQVEKLYHDLTKPVEPPPVEKKVIPNLETKEIEKKEEDKKDTTGGVKQLDERLNQYSKEQLVKSNGFCYIGYDQQRECTSVSDGDVCMSGQVFPTLEVCMNPHLRP